MGPADSMCFYVSYAYFFSHFRYLWSEVLSADMYATRFDGKCLDRSAGLAYRDSVLGVGGKGDCGAAVEKFLGRPVSEQPFLRARGIASS